MIDQNGFPRPMDKLIESTSFGPREVGLSHPDLPSYIRLRDNGDIEISPVAGLGIVLSSARRTITLMADQVKFLTREHDGLRWNKLSFNDQATAYTEPAFNYIQEDEMRNPYRGVDAYLDGGTTT